MAALAAVVIGSTCDDGSNWFPAVGAVDSACVGGFFTLGRDFLHGLPDRPPRAGARTPVLLVFCNGPDRPSVVSTIGKILKGLKSMPTEFNDCLL